MRILKSETGMVIYIADGKDDYQRVLGAIKDKSVEFLMHVPRIDDINWNAKEPPVAIYDGIHDYYHRVAYCPVGGYVIRDIKGDASVTFVPKETIDWSKI